MKFTPSPPRICLSNRWTLDKDLLAASHFIEVVDNKPDKDRELPKAVREYRLYEFIDATPEEIIGKPIKLVDPSQLRELEGVIASQAEVKDILDLIHKYVSRPIEGSLVFYESSYIDTLNYAGRSSVFAIAAEYLYCKNHRWAVFNVASRYKHIKPNLWIAGLVDYTLDVNGEFFKVINELVGFGIVVSPAGESVEMDWAKDEPL